MFLRRNWRNRAVGLIGAYAVLIAGVAASGGFDSATSQEDAPTVHASHQPAVPAQTKRANDCSSALEDRNETVC